MKTITMRSLLMIFFLFAIPNAYSYEVRINQPGICEDSPTFLFQNESFLKCELGPQVLHPLDTDPAHCVISIEQNNTSVVMYEGNFPANQLSSITLNVSDFPNLCFNEPARVKFDCTPIDFPMIHYYASAYFMVYSNNYSCHFGSITNGSPQLIHQGFATFFRSNSCSVSSGNYYVKQYKITFTLNGNFTDYIPEVVPENCSGFTGALPNHQQHCAYKIHQSPTQAVFGTFVYQLWDIEGRYIGWLPSDTHQATVVYKKLFVAQISGITQIPNPCAPPNNTTFLYCNLLEGSGGEFYEWKDTLRPPGVQFDPFGHYLRVTFPPSNNNDRSVPPYEVSVRVLNLVGSSPWKKYRINREPYVSQCPFITSGEDENKIYENAILINPGSNSETNKTDHFIMKHPGIIGNDNVEFGIEETGNDNTSLDQLKLKHISFDACEEIAVSENGKVINYINESGKAKFTLNEKEEPDGLLDAKDDDAVDIKEGDHLKIQYVPDGSSHVIMTMRQPQVKERPCGIFTDNKGNIDTFFVRSNESDVCIELKGDEKGELEIIAEQPFKINQIAIAKNLNSAKVSEQKIISAIHNNYGEVSDLLGNEDEKKVNIGPGEKMKIKFTSNDDTTKKNAYLIESTGRVKKGSEDLKEKIRNNSMSMLSDNIPNPFNPVTKIKFNIPVNGNVKLTVYDIAGREIKKLIDEFRHAGNYELDFDGSNLASGIYFYKLETRDFIQTKRMTLLK